MRPEEHTLKGVKIFCRLGGGNYWLNGKGVHRGVDSERYKQGAYRASGSEVKKHISPDSACLPETILSIYDLSIATDRDIPLYKILFAS